MTKTTRDPNQLNFNFFASRSACAAPSGAHDAVARPSGLENGSQTTLSDFERGLRLLLKTVLAEAQKRDADPLTRDEVARRMTERLGRTITRQHIDGWVALSAIERRIHTDALKALCEVTGDFRPLHHVVESCGYKALHPDEAICAEFGASVLAGKLLADDRRRVMKTVDRERLAERLRKRMLKHD